MPQEHTFHTDHSMVTPKRHLVLACQGAQVGRLDFGMSHAICGFGSHQGTRARHQREASGEGFVQAGI